MCHEFLPKIIVVFDTTDYMKFGAENKTFVSVNTDYDSKFSGDVETCKFRGMLKSEQTD